MPDLEQIRKGLAGMLASIEGLQESAYILGSPTPPSAEVLPAPIEYDLTMGRGTDRWMLTVRAFVSFGSDIGAQKRLDLFIAPTGPNSVKTALEAKDENGKYLAGLAGIDSVHVKSCSGYRVVDRPGGGPVLAVEWTVEVIASN